MKKFARDIKSTVEALNKSDSKEAINLKRVQVITTYG